MRRLIHLCESALERGSNSVQPDCQFRMENISEYFLEKEIKALYFA